jgi:hypothetical protein
MRVENTYANDVGNMRVHLQSIVDRFGSIDKLGQRRFLQLYKACYPTIDEIRTLTDILVANSQR